MSVACDSGQRWKEYKVENINKIMNNKIIKVADLSQPIKIAIFMIFFMAVIFGYFDLRSILSSNSLGGGGIDQFNSITDTQVEIGTTLSQPIGADGSRRYLMIQNQGSVPVFCLLEGFTVATDSSVTSTAGRETGIRLNSPQATTSTSPSFLEIKGYTGVINCTAATRVSSTIITSP